MQLNRLVPPFSSSDSNTIIHRQYKDFSITDFTFIPRSASRNNRVNGWLDELFIHCDLQLYLSEQVDAELMAPIDPRLSSLASKSLAVHDSQTKHLNLGQSLFDGFQLTWLDDGDDQFHGYGSPT